MTRRVSVAARSARSRLYTWIHTSTTPILKFSSFDRDARGSKAETSWCRIRVCLGFEWCALKLDSDRNQQVINYEGRISTDDSHLQAYVIPTEQGLMIAQEAVRCAGSSRSS